MNVLGVRPVGIGGCGTAGAAGWLGAGWAGVGSTGAGSDATVRLLVVVVVVVAFLAVVLFEDTGAAFRTGATGLGVAFAGAAVVFGAGAFTTGTADGLAATVGVGVPVDVTG